MLCRVELIPITKTTYNNVYALDFNYIYVRYKHLINKESTKASISNIDLYDITKRDNHIFTYIKDVATIPATDWSKMTVNNTNLFYVLVLRIGKRIKIINNINYLKYVNMEMDIRFINGNIKILEVYKDNI